MSHFVLHVVNTHSSYCERYVSQGMEKIRSYTQGNSEAKIHAQFCLSPQSNSEPSAERGAFVREAQTYIIVSVRKLKGAEINSKKVPKVFLESLTRTAISSQNYMLFSPNAVTCHGVGEERREGWINSKLWFTREIH